jgi:hypothetical protein
MARSETNQAYEAALTRAITDRAAQGDVLRDRRRGVLEAVQRLGELTRLARHLLQELPLSAQARFLKEHPWLVDGPDPASRQAVMTGIIQLFSRNRDRKLTAPDVEQGLAAQGIHADTKRIYNTLNYLAADDRLERVERGLYRATPKLTAPRSEVA